MMDKTEFERLLDQAEENARSDWEHEFVDSLIQKSKDPCWEPTDRQWEKLEELAAQMDLWR
jgi:hypothetical protein